MDKKIIIGIIAVVVIFIIRILYQGPSFDEPEQEQDEVLVFLQELKQETGMNFSESQYIEFQWNVKKYDEIQAVNIIGNGFEAQEILNEDQVKVRSFFENNGFVEDLYNIASGAMVESIGYKKEYLVCVVISGVSGYEQAVGQWIPSDPDKWDIEVKCGQGDESIVPLASKQEQIKQVFADKYNKKLSQISIDIKQETENHVRGQVTFEPGGPGETGLFLATKVQDHWELVFDGTGVISCEKASKYNFPENMVEDCENTQTIEVENNGEFLIVLESNPTTGYSWKADFDSEYIELISKDYTEGPNDPGIVGAGGADTFKFGALLTGETKITFSYLRSWEENVDPIDKKVYEITIK